MVELEVTSPALAGSELSGSPGGSGGVFVGRERELIELRRALDAACDGQGRMAMLVGEAGIGKTRVAAELAREARERGCRVLFGRCHEDRGAPAYWPWIQIIRGYAEERDPEALLADLGPCAADVAYIFPALRERLGSLPEPALLPPEQARFRAFDGVSVLLRRLAIERPLLILIEDLHWVDHASLMLLSFLVHELAHARVLMVVTEREDEIGQAHPLAEAAAELMRAPGSLRIELRGLTRAEVLRYIAATSGLAPDATLVESVYQASDGNPLFLIEILRLLATERAAGSVGDLATCGIPSTVRAVIRRRLALLSPSCRELLAVAAVVGREFDLALLGHLGHLGRLGGTAPAGSIDEALTAKVLGGVPERPGRFRFSHALVRDALYDELGTAERLALHRSVGEALEERYAASPQPHLSELAHHFFRAAPAGDTAKAIGYALRAAAHSAATLAHEEAARFYERALRLVEQDGGDERRCCELQLLASESHLRAGDAAKAASGFSTVTQAASRLREPELFARGALGASGQVVALGAAEPRIVRMLEQARHLLPEEDSALRACVLARLATECFFLNDEQRSIALTEEAVAVARRLGDLHTLAVALAAKRDQQWRGEDLAVRLDEAGDLLRLALDARDDEVALLAYHWRILDLFEIGEVGSLEVELKSFAALAHEQRDPLALYRVAGLRATYALLQGRFADLERHGADLLARGRSVSPSNSLHAYYGQRSLFHWVHGELESVLSIAQRSAASFRGLAPWHAAVSAALAKMGRTDEARRKLHTLVGPGLATIPNNFFRAPTLSILGYASWRLGEADHAARIYPLLAPYAGRNLMIGFAAAAWGAVDYFLGLTASAMGDVDRAERHLVDAIELDLRMRALPFLAEARYELGVLLLGRGRAGDGTRARELLDDALHGARELGLASLEKQVVARLVEMETSSVAVRNGKAPRAFTPESHGVEWLFRSEGEYWSIGEPDRAVRLKDTVGLRYLAQLLRSAGSDLLALDVACAVRGDEHATQGSVSSSDPRLDDAALRSYRSRLGELRERLEGRRALDDARGAALIEDEIAEVAAELSQAIGLGGRVRPLAASASERARQNVTRAIRKAIRRITVNDRRVGHYLASNVRTGTFCSYDPSPEPRVTWVF